MNRFGFTKLQQDKRTANNYSRHGKEIRKGLEQSMSGYERDRD